MRRRAENPRGHRAFQVKVRCPLDLDGRATYGSIVLLLHPPHAAAVVAATALRATELRATAAPAAARLAAPTAALPAAVLAAAKAAPAALAAFAGAGGERRGAGRLVRGGLDAEGLVGRDQAVAVAVPLAELLQVLA